MDSVVIEVWVDEDQQGLGAYVQVFSEDEDEEQLADEVAVQVDKRVPPGTGGRGELNAARIGKAVGALFGVAEPPEGLEI